MKTLWLCLALLSTGLRAEEAKDPMETDVCRNFILLSTAMGKITDPQRTPDVIKKMEDDRKKTIAEFGVPFCKEQYKELRKVITSNENFASLVDEYPPL